VTLQKVSPTLGRWIAHIELVDYKVIIGINSHFGYLLGEIRLYKVILRYSNYILISHFKMIA
jgi:hypothetical protein